MARKMDTSKKILEACKYVPIIEVKKQRFLLHTPARLESRPVPAYTLEKEDVYKITKGYLSNSVLCGVGKNLKDMSTQPCIYGFASLVEKLLRKKS
jgi:hypothetical protein